MDIPNKDERVAALVGLLLQRLGANSFQLVDHWPEDPFAIGIASPTDARVLAYVSVNPDAAEPYFVSLELSPEAEADLPYSPGDERNECGIEEVAAMVAMHLKRMSTSFRAG
jgi:hypothetical protein